MNKKYRYCYKVFTKDQNGYDYMYIYGSTKKEAKQKAISKKWYWQGLGIKRVMIKKVK